MNTLKIFSAFAIAAVLMACSQSTTPTPVPTNQPAASDTSTPAASIPPAPAR